MEYLTAGEVAQVLERGAETVADWLADGRLPSMWIHERLMVPMVAVWPHRQVSESDD